MSEVFEIVKCVCQGYLHVRYVKMIMEFRQKGKPATELKWYEISR